MVSEPQTKSSNGTIHIGESDGPRPVVISPANEDRFVRTCQEAVEACRMHVSREVWLEELASLLGHVAHWADQQSNLVQSCYAAPRDGQVVIFIVPTSNHFDFELTDKMTELDLDLSAKYRAVPCDVIQIPGKSGQGLDTFLDRKLATHVYGQDHRSQAEMDTQSELFIQDR